MTGERERNDRSLRLTDLLGLPVTVGERAPEGRVADLTLRIGEETPLVDRVIVERRGARSAPVDWSRVVTAGPDRVELAPGPDIARSEDGPLLLADDELLLGRDVLDTQVVDVDGKRLARVGEVLLTRTRDGRLRAAAVDTGFGAVCRRLGSNWLSHRLGEQAVPWESIHLTSARGHVVQLTTPSAMLHRLDAGEIGMLLDAVTTTSGVDIVRGVHPDIAAGALAESHPNTAARLVRSLHHDEVADLVDRLPRHHADAIARHRSAEGRSRRFLRHDGWRRRVPARRTHR